MDEKKKTVKRPNFFSSKEECEAEKQKDKELKKKGVLIQTNPRYKNFFQEHFTVGDPDQFESYRNKTMLNPCFKEMEFKNDFKLNDISSINWDKYKNIESKTIKDTFNYIFYKFKKGIFTQIKDNKVTSFLPFSNSSFYNEWGNRMKVDPALYKDFGSLYSAVQHASGFPANLKTVNRNPYAWYSNNCLIRYEYPINEGDTNIPIIDDMFQTLCQERKINDVEFFINKRDFPLLNKDGFESYSEMFDKDDLPLLSHSYKKYCPIFSMCYTDSSADIPIPTHEDWARVCYKENKFFVDTCGKDYTMNTNTPWENKKSTAVFRGTNTGCGTTIQTNPRLKACWLSVQKENKENNYIDAGLVSWNTRIRKMKGQKYLQFPNPKSFPFDKVKSLKPIEQAEYKYILHIQGHVSAFRLSLELESKCCLLIVESKYKLWYSHLLKEYEHYVPVKADLSNLFDQVKWCRENDQKCKTIAENAYAFSQKYLSKEAILNYLENLLYVIKKNNGIYIYNTLSISEVIQNLEIEKIKSVEFPVSNKPLNKIQYVSRTFGFLKCFQYILNSTISNKIPFDKEEKYINKKNNDIMKCMVGNYEFIKKNSKNTHEYFVGAFATNNLAKVIPNFAFTFAKTETSLYTEFVKGMTLANYLVSDRFEIGTFVDILIQVALSLQVAQREFLFVHNDLGPNNIILSEMSSPVTFNYILQNQTVYSIESTIVPVIIDFQRSHVVVEGMKYTYKDLFSFSSIQDIYMLIAICFKDLIENRKFTPDEIEKLVYIANFFTNTEFKRNRFENIFDLKNFFQPRKFSDLLYSDKKDLEKKTPFDFIKYILSEKFRFNIKLNIKKDTLYKTNNLYGGNPLQLFNLAYASTEEEQIKTFYDFFNKIANTNFSSSNALANTYINVAFFQSLYMVYKVFLNFIESIGGGSVEDNNKIREMYDKCIEIVDKNYKIPSNLDLQLTILRAMLGPLLNDDFFENIDTVSLFLSETKNVDCDVFKNINMVFTILYNQHFLEYDERNFSKAFDMIDNISTLSSYATIFTVRKLYKIIYKSDTENPLLKQNCKEAENYLSKCNKILQ